ncbi:MAG: P-loop NTPase fold protein [Bacteroidota bacterium]
MDKLHRRKFARKFKILIINQTINFLRSFNNRPTIITGIALAIFISFYPFFEDLYLRIFVHYFLSSFQKDWIAYSLTVLLIAISIFVVIVKIKKRRPFCFYPNLLIIVSILIAFYFSNIQRPEYETKEYVFYNIKFINLKFFSIYFSDIIFISIILFVIPIKRKNNCLKKTGLPRLLEDSFDTFNKVDLFNRKDQAILLSKLISNSHTKKSFAIGIEGSWGSGKSVFIDFVVDELLKNMKDNLFVRFYPWRCKECKNIIGDFLKQLENAIKEFYPEISKDIAGYADSINTLGNSYADMFIKNSNFFKEESDSYTLYETISKKLSKINQRIIVVIDDLDRLDKEEIMEVLKIVRNTGNFPNTYFLLAYQRDYIDFAISQINEKNSRNFLDKIVQLEVTLPSIRKDDIFDKTVDFFNKYLRDDLKKEAVDAITSIYHIQDSNQSQIPHTDDYKDNNLFCHLISNLRDVVRLINYLNANYHSRFENLLLLDEIILLELLKMKFIDLFYSIKEKKIVHYGINTDTPVLVIEDNERDLFKKHYYEYNSFACNAIDISLNFLFNNDTDNPERNEYKKIKNLNNFNLYFYPESYKELKNTEFNTLLKTFEPVGTSAFLNRNGMMNQFIKKLIKVEKFSDCNEFENCILYCRYFYSENDAALIIKIIESLKNDVQNFKNYYNDNNERYFSFIENFFLNANSPYTIESSIATEILQYKLQEEYPSYVALNVEKLQGFLMTYLSKYIVEDHELNKIYFALFKNCIDRIDKVNTKFIHIDEAKEKIKNLLKKHERSFIDVLLIEPIKVSNGHIYAIRPEIEDIFNNWDDFENFINGFSESREILLLKTFYRRFKIVSYKPIHFQKGTLEIISDQNTLSCLNTKSNELSNDTIENHPYLEKIRMQDPLLKYCKWINYPIELSDTEAKSGSKYHFKREMNLDLSKFNLTYAKIVFAVDDWLTLNINNKIAVTKTNTGSTIAIMDIDTTFFEQNYNIFEFEVENTAGGPKSTKDMNPYGLIYRIELHLEEKQ